MKLRCAVRVIIPEVGLSIDALGPLVWTKTAHFTMGEWDGQVDHVYLIRTDRFEPSPALTRSQLMAEHVRGSRWWSPTELAASDSTFAPRALARLLADLLRDGTPAEPLQISGF